VTSTEPTHAAGAAPEAALTCRKCGLTQAEAAACRRCGLARDRMADFAGPAPAPAPPAVDAAWAQVEAEWGAQARHQALVAAALDAGALPALARLYRSAAATRGDPGERADAERRAREVGTLAAAALAVGARPRPDPAPASYKGLKTVVLIVVVIALVGAILAVLRPPPRQPDRTQGGPREVPVAK
jgi:hypothetical protein